MSHITSHVLGVFDLQARFRLISTGFWGICFMGSIIWSVISFELDNPSALGLLRFPTVCIIGFIPHILVLAGIITWLWIYGLALFLSLCAVERGLPLSNFRQRMAHAHNGLQANIPLSDIRITREMDFYTALLRTGLSAITMASEAVYLNEDRGVSLQRRTWLEEKRLREVEEMQRQCMAMGLPGSGFEQAGTIGRIPLMAGSIAASNGYVREHAAQKLQKSHNKRGLWLGIGATGRGSRCFMAIEYLLAICKLVAKVCALSTYGLIGKLRIRGQLAWLLSLAGYSKPEHETNQDLNEGHGSSSRHSVLDNEAGFIPTIDGIDVEEEFRQVSGSADEEGLEVDLYRYWLKGRWWGSKDSSGDFCPRLNNDDWDNTSVVSTTSTTSGIEDEQFERDFGNQQIIPTETLPQASDVGSAFNDSPLGIADLARLLHPTCREERDDALRLAAHLQCGQIMTRAAFRRMEKLQRAQILIRGWVFSNPEVGRGGHLAKLGNDEEVLLEQILLSRRQTAPKPASHALGGVGANDENAPCVVYQSSSRTIILWPCGCLSLCNDFRVSLAMKNFDKCVCCRQDVMSFSRISVP